MNKHKKTSVTVIKTEKMDTNRVSRITRKYNVAPIDVRDLQDGLPVKINKSLADELEKQGFIERTKEKVSEVRRPFTGEPAIKKADIDTEDKEQKLTTIEDFSKIELEENN